MNGLRYSPLVLILAIFLIYMPAVAHADDLPWKGDLVKPQTQQICNQHESLAFPSGDQPAAAEMSALKDCDSDKLYYGVGMKADYTAARKCAFSERAAKAGSEFSGAPILEMIYANGYGVKKDLDLAIKLACDAGGAPAEIEGRVEHLTELKTLLPRQTLEVCRTEKDYPADYCRGVFDICDDITSGYMQGVCAANQSRITEAGNSRAFDKITANWPPQDQEAFKKLDKAARTYFDLHSGNEIDLSGTARAAQEIEENDGIVKQFRATVAKFEKGQFPPVANAADFAEADKRLNETYAATLGKAKKSGNLGTIKSDDIRDTQRAWLAYRDAWVAFAAQHYPAFSSDSVKTWATRERISMLKAVQGDIY